MKTARLTKCFFTIFIYFFIQITNRSVLGRLDSNSATRIITQYGYPVEEHANIETEDGYLLDMQRIPHGRNNHSNESTKPPVLIMHGILGSAENWIVTGPEKGLAFILADQGYDVWLGNARGSTHSRKHKTLNPDFGTEFWQFSWHEIGIYDLPAKIDYILAKTGQSQLFYIGHSQGTTSFFVMASERPSYNQKIRLMIAMAPVAYMSNLSNPFLQIMSRFEEGVNWILGAIGMNLEFLPNNDLMSLAGEALCNEKAAFQEVCTNVLFLIAGYDSTQMNRTALPEILSASPAGSSTKQLLHYAQSITSGTFSYYDYGYFMNLMKYGSSAPPRYRLNRVSAPVGLFYAKNDWLVSSQDVEKLQRQLPNVVYSYLIPYDLFNHLDFLWANSVVEMVYQEVIDLLKKYESPKT